MDENLSVKEKYDLEKLKKQKNKTIDQTAGNKLPVSKIVWGIVVLGVIALIVWIVSQPKIERPEPEFLEGVSELGEAVPVLASPHIGFDTDNNSYNSNPPTSGPHYVDAPNPGFYKNGLKDQEAVHGLEHGYIWISYTSAVDDATLQKLQAIQRANFGSVMLSPREGNDASIVLASWGRMLKMEAFDEATINTYIKLHKNQSPEPFAK